MARYRKAPLRRNHHIRPGQRFVSASGRKGLVTGPPAGGYYPVVWDNGKPGKVKDTWAAARPILGNPHEDNSFGDFNFRAPRGLALASAATRIRVSSLGGLAAHEKGVAHTYTSEEARVAGRKGGKAAWKSGRAHRWTSQTASVAARRRRKNPGIDTVVLAVLPFVKRALGSKISAFNALPIEERKKRLREFLSGRSRWRLGVVGGLAASQVAKSDTLISSLISAIERHGTAAVDAIGR